MVKKYSQFILIFVIILPGIIYSQWNMTSTPPSSGGRIISSGDKLIASTGSIYFSSNFGYNWFFTNLTSVSFSALTSIGNKVFAGNSNGLFYSSNNGVNWITTPVNTYPIEYLASNDSFLYAGTNTGVYRSTNNGLNWNATSVNYITYALGVSGNRVLASVLDNVLYTALIFRSSNGGVTWSNFYSGLPDAIVNNFAFNSTSYFAGFNSGLYGIYKSTDYGEHWVSCNIGKNVYSITTLNNNIFVGTTNGVSLSTNNGIIWTEINQGLPVGMSVNNLLIYSDYLFASLNNGIWRRPLSEVIAGITIQSISIPKYYSLSQNYPNPFNPVSRIDFDLPKSGFVNLRVFDILGREVRTIINEEKTAGTYSVDFNASDLSSGVYFYKLCSGDFSEIKKMILFK